MRKALIAVATLVILWPSASVMANDDIEALKRQLETMKKEYEQRIQALEKGLRAAQEKADLAQAQAEKTALSQQQVEQKIQAQKTANDAVSQASVSSTGGTSTTTSQNAFNPALSVILDGTYAAYDNDPDQYRIPGFPSGGHEGGLIKEGFSVGHTEISASASIDQLFYGKLTLAVADHEGSTEVELEEAYFETLGLSNGFNIKGGRFYSAIGYLNQQHAHQWDFADAPLVYRSFFANQLSDDGLQVTYLAPTDTYLLLGAEIADGSRYPAGGDQNGVGAWTAFANIGGDIGIEHSWQFGLSHWQANDIDDRSGAGHDHESEHLEIPTFSGESKINGVNLVYKWAPNGDPTSRNFRLQFEYFERTEDGSISMQGSDPLETSSYDGDQNGWYAQAFYQFRPQWAAAVRYDQLGSHNRGSDKEILAEAGLDNESHTPRRYSAMVEWLPSEYSRIRLQYNRDESYQQADNQVYVQYTMSLGAHAAHAF